MGLIAVPQKQFLKGLNAAVAYNSQPRGTVPRLSNLTLTTRGALRTVDQNLGISTFNGAGPATTEGPFTSVQFFQPGPATRKVLAFQRDTDTPVTVPTGLAVSDGGSGGSLAAGTYFYKITAVDAAGGETTASSEVSITITSGHQPSLSWTADPGAYGYNIYRSTTSGSEVLLLSASLPVIGATSFLDDGSATTSVVANVAVAPGGTVATTITKGGHQLTQVVFTLTAALTFKGSIQSFVVAGNSNSVFNITFLNGSLDSSRKVVTATMTLITPQTGGGGTLTITGIAPPVTNTTQVLSLIDVSGLSFTKPGSVISTFPIGSFPPVPSFPVGAVGGSYSGAAGGGSQVNPAPGNVAGVSGPLPDLVAFAGKMILVLGNGLAPYQSDGTSGGTTSLANTFTGAYSAWVAATTFLVGDIINPSGASGFLFKCIQQGTSGSSQPTWNTAQGAYTNDGTALIWQQVGSSAIPAPRGAAHGINHAGSLWLWNTSPTDSTDLLDGPSVLKMSDANNPNSWNPVNVAGVGRNDGQQGMGMASFTIAESGIAPEGSLVLFKEFSTYQVTGVFGATDFAIQKAQTDLGCIAPRTIKFVPGFGIMRLSHLGVAVFDGVRDRLVSEDIRPYLFGDYGDIAQVDFSWAYAAKADVVAQPPMYVLAAPVLGNGNDGRLTRIFCYDLVLKAWSITDLPFGIGALRQLLIPGGEPVTVFGGWNDAMISRWMVGDQLGWQAWLDPTLVTHNGTPLVWSVRTPAVVGQSATDRLMIRRLLMRGSWRGNTLQASGQFTADNSTGTSSFTASVTLAPNRGVAAATSPPRSLLTPRGATDDASIELVTEIGVTALEAYATIGGTQKVGGAPFEIAEFDWQVVQRPVGTLATV